MIFEYRGQYLEVTKESRECKASGGFSFDVPPRSQWAVGHYVTQRWPGPTT